MSRRHRLGAAAAALASAAALAGCSQIAAIAPVSGGHLAEVRYAGLDVLVDAGIEILTAPVCSETAGAVGCEGETVAGQPISVRSSAEDPATVVVEVGGREIYSGSIQEVIDRAARGES